MTCDTFIYTTGQKYLATLKFFYFSSKIFFFMKQVKHYSDFIYYTKYKSSWATLDINWLRKNTKTSKSSDASKWPLLAAVTTSLVLSILSTKDRRETEESSAQLSCMSCPRWAALVVCLALTFWSSLSHSSSMVFKSIDCTD